MKGVVDGLGLHSILLTRALVVLRVWVLAEILFVLGCGRHDTRRWGSNVERESGGRPQYILGGDPGKGGSTDGAEDHQRHTRKRLMRVLQLPHDEVI